MNIPPVCPSYAHITAVAISMGVLVALLAGCVAHGVLRPLMEARGVTPWLVRDSVGALPLVLIGAALVGGSASVFAMAGAMSCVLETMIVIAISVKMIFGIAMLRLGLLALRKLV